MNIELRKKWIAELRSPDRKQCRGMLKNGDAFCCLGVFCDISGKGEWVPGAYKLHTDGELIEMVAQLNKSMMDEAGINADIQHWLIAMNDGRHAFQDNPKSFAEIADYLETLI